MAEKQKKTRAPKVVRGRVSPTTTDSVVTGIEPVAVVPQNEVVSEVVFKANESYYIHAKWSKTSFLKNAIDAVKDIINQTNVDWTEEGITIQGMDNSHVALSNVFLSGKDCIFYHIKESITVGIDMIRLSKLLGISEVDDSLEFFIKSDDDATINMTLVSVDGKKRSHFQIPLLDIDSASMNIPEMVYKAEIVQNSGNILATVRDLGLFGESVGIGINESEFYIRVEGEFGKGERVWKDGILKTTKNIDEINQSYPIKYMLMALKGNSVNSEVKLEISRGSPIRISYSFGKGSKIVNYVAPKMEDID